MTAYKTQRLSLPYILPAQAQKHLTHNEALAKLDHLIHLSIIDDQITVPPANPEDGDGYILGAEPTGFGSGKTNDVVFYKDGSWNVHPGIRGMVAWVSSRNRLIVFNGEAWENLPHGDITSFQTLGVNASADAINKLVVKSDAVLLSHNDDGAGSGDMRLVINKAASSQTSSLVFQSGYSGHVEMGLAGTNDFSIKFSPDGQSFLDAMIVDANNGGVAFPHASIGQTKKVVISTGSGTYTPPATVKSLSVILVGGGGGGAGAKTSSGAEFVGAGGGGAGGVCQHVFDFENLPENFNYSVGLGGSGGTAPASAPFGSRNGADGTRTQLSTAALTITAHGGKGAPEDEASSSSTQFAGGLGGAAVGAQLNISGQNGGGGVTKAGDFYQLGFGVGGSGAFGQGGSFQNGDGNSGNGFGSGGSGCGMIPGFILNRAGGNGAPGILIITEYY